MKLATPAALSAIVLAAACTMGDAGSTGTASPNDPVVVVPEGGATAPKPGAPVVVPPSEAGPGAPKAGDTCGAAPFQKYVGQKSPEITVPAGTNVRHYRAGDPITMDFLPSRMNFEYDRTGKLVKVSCG